MALAAEKHVIDRAIWQHHLYSQRSNPRHQDMGDKTLHAHITRVMSACGQWSFHAIVTVRDSTNKPLWRWRESVSQQCAVLHRLPSSSTAEADRAVVDGLVSPKRQARTRSGSSSVPRGAKAGMKTTVATVLGDYR